MSGFPDFKVSADLKAFEQPHDPPILGDVRPTKDVPSGTSWRDITEFEVWDGYRWRAAQDEIVYGISF